MDLADNEPAYNYSYVVCVQTGSRRNSGTTANVVCVITGMLVVLLLLRIYKPSVVKVKN